MALLAVAGTHLTFLKMQLLHYCGDPSQVRFVLDTRHSDKLQREDVIFVTKVDGHFDAIVHLDSRVKSSDESEVMLRDVLVM